MNVYSIIATGKYGRGMAIVAAETEQDAIIIASGINDPYWYVRYDKPDEVRELPLVYTGEPAVIEHFETGE